MVPARALRQQQEAFKKLLAKQDERDTITSRKKKHLSNLSCKKYFLFNAHYPSKLVVPREGYYRTGEDMHQPSDWDLTG